LLQIVNLKGPLFGTFASMIRSMTGYGRALAELPSGRLAAEVRSVNGKSAELTLRIPRRYGAREFAWRAAWLPRLGRGTATLQLAFEESERTPTLNEPLILAYAAQLSELAAKAGYATYNPMDAAMRLPDVLRTSTEPDEAEWETVETLIAKAFQEFDGFRVTEGSNTAYALQQSVLAIESRLGSIVQLEPERIATTKTRLQTALAELGAAFNQDRYEQELIYYIDKMDFAEEKQRLTQHLVYFMETLQTDADAGRKLGFIAQEIGREMNTLGSKAYHAGIQRLVVEMKNELEKIKEQVANVL